MKSTIKLILLTLVVSGAGLSLTGCVGEVGVEGGYYGGGPWFHDGGWMDGGRWGGPRGGVGIEIHPPGHRR